MLWKNHIGREERTGCDYEGARCNLNLKVEGAWKGSANDRALTTSSYKMRRQGHSGRMMETDIYSKIEA